MNPASLASTLKRKEAKIIRARTREIVTNRSGTPDQRRQRFLHFLRSVPADMKVHVGLELVALNNELIAARKTK